MSAVFLHLTYYKALLIAIDMKNLFSSLQFFLIMSKSITRDLCFMYRNDFKNIAIFLLHCYICMILNSNIRFEMKRNFANSK